MQLFVFVFKEGPLAAAGHDLRLRAGIGGRMTTEPPSVELDVDAASLVVDTAMRDGRPDWGALSAADKQEIERKMRTDVLATKHHPRITFRSTRVEVEPSRYRVTGDLSLRGVVRELCIDVARTATPHGEKLDARFVIHQPDFGIPPYRALLGALKVKPDVTVVYSSETLMIGE